MTQQFTVQTPEFTGPLDLLLQLIEKRKLFIGDIPLAGVADDFLEHIQQLESFPLESAAHFLVVASTLLLIKSRSLLPYVELTEEENEDIAELERRLELYKQIRELSKHVKERFGKKILFTTSHRAPVEPVFAPHESLNTQDLYRAAQRVIETFPPVENVPRTVVQKVMSLEEMIERLTKRIQDDSSLHFSEMSKRDSGNMKEKKLHVIISFLALLELVKKGMIAAEQQGVFEDIAVQKT